MRPRFIYRKPLIVTPLRSFKRLSQISKLATGHCQIYESVTGFKTPVGIDVGVVSLALERHHPLGIVQLEN